MKNKYFSKYGNHAKFGIIAKHIKIQNQYNWFHIFLRPKSKVIKQEINQKRK